MEYGVMEKVEKRGPQHLKLINSSLNWDWRRENPVEIIVLVFVLLFFFFLPRTGCGVTSMDAGSQPAPAAPVAPAAPAP